MNCECFYVVKDNSFKNQALYGGTYGYKRIRKEDSRRCWV